MIVYLVFMENTEQIWSVSDVNRAVREIVEGSLLPFWLRGEVGSLVIHRSGHVYFTIKDTRSQMRGVFFGGAAACTKLGVANGTLIEAFGNLTVYEVRGEYQFSARQLRLAGIGDLQLRFEAVKNKLAAEGLFDPGRKRPIPVLPRRIGVVTSPSGAAIRDFLQIINRRFPNVNVRIYPCAVQGAGAAEQVARGVDFFSRTRGADVVVVTRGGGSMEDLWPFNEEVVARAVAACSVPVISAVGHEIDFTICDFAADLRVPTPSAAAELVSQGVSLVLGSYGSGVSIAGGPTFGSAGIPAIGVTCTNPNVTAGNDYYFRICFLDPFQGTVLANFAMDNFDAQVAYCLGEAGNEYDQGLIAYFTQAFEAAGGTVITDSFPTNNSDFNTYLNKAKSEGADVIFTPVSIAYATQILSQAASLGIEAPFLGSDTLDDNMVLEAISGTDIQLYVSTFYQEGGNADFDAGIKEYINTAEGALDANGGNDTIAAVSAMGYDAYYVALEAIKAAGSTDPAAIKTALWDVTYTGVTGDIAFDDVNGDAIRDTAYIKHSTNDGAWELETVQTVEQ